MSSKRQSDEHKIDSSTDFEGSAPKVSKKNPKNQPFGELPGFSDFDLGDDLFKQPKKVSTSNTKKSKGSDSDHSLSFQSEMVSCMNEFFIIKYNEI